jgi:type IX secretion system PorP/SprF family membrane protein
MTRLKLTYREIIWVVLCIVASGRNAASAQQEWSYTQYQFNLFDANSAYAGNHQTLSLAVRHRSQWIGLEGAPVTEQFSAHAPLMGNRLGVGLRVVSDRIGARKQQLFKSSVAYKLQTMRGQFAVGITAGFLRSSIERGDLTAFDMNDEQLLHVGVAQVTPVVGAAVFYTTNRAFFGAETGSLNRTSLSDAKGSFARLYRNANVIGGFIQPLGENDLIQVSSQLKWSEGQQLQSEVNAHYLYRNKYMVGAGYRFGSAWQMLASCMVNEQFRIGLSYDSTIGKLMRNNQSSAELFLGYTLRKRTSGVVRYF